MSITVNSQRYMLQSVKNGLRILKAFSKERPELGITEIARSVGMHKSTVSRYVKSLVQEGFLQINPDNGKYRLGLSLLCLSGVITSHLEIRHEAKSTLHQLVERTGEAAHISVLEGANIVYLDKVESKHPVRLLSDIGRINPAFCTSSGKVLLAHQPEASVERIIAAGLPRMGPGTITDPEQFRQNLREVREQGFAVCIDELHEGAVSIGAPVRDYTGEVIAAVSVVGPTERMSGEKIPAIVAAVVDAGREISQKLGYMGGNMP
jgi:DNA-binding IclR family transcriptional regulator